MNRFALIRNIELLTRHLDSGKKITEPGYYLALIRNDRSALALLDAADRGACEHSVYSSAFSFSNFDEYTAQFPGDCEPSLFPCITIDPRPGLLIADINPAGALELMQSPAELIGRHLFEAFPENAATLETEGLANIFALLVAVMATGEPQILNEQRYDIHTIGAVPVERHWWIKATPLFDTDGQVAFIKQEFCQIAPRALNQAA